ncbi:MAG: AraC family transcriptional regulator [Candidatus Azobacteroides sp.]|nr:AraC family transcriptional regulator [Candidatus Azobacteroides sp.]
MRTKQKLYKFNDPVYYTCYNQVTYREINEPFHRLIHIMEGSFHITISGKEYEAQTGEYMLLAKGNLARIKMIPSPRSGYFRLICVNISNKALKRYLQQNTYPENRHYIPVTVKKLPSHDLWDILFSDLKLSINKNYILDRNLMNMKSQQTLYILNLLEKDLMFSLFHSDEFPRKDLQEYMEQNYMFNVPLKVFAEYSGRSLSTFRREFEKFFNTTPTRWLLSRRLEEAYKRLATGTVKPVQIYLEVGFETQAHFNRCFKQKYGISPGQIRKIIFHEEVR